MRARARGVLLLVLWACTARANHTRRSRAKAQEVLIQNIKEQLVTENDDYVPNDESDANLVPTEANSEINEREPSTEPSTPESTTQPEQTQSAPATAASHPDPNDHELDETQFEIAFGSNIPRPEIKIVRKAHRVYQEPKIAQSEFQFDHLEPNTTPPEPQPDHGQINPVFAQLEPSLAQPEFAPDLDIDQLEPNTPTPEPNTAETSIGHTEPHIARPQFKFAPLPTIAQPEYDEFEFTPQSKYIKRKNSGLDTRTTSEPDPAEPDVENISNLRIFQQEDKSTTFQKSAMLVMVEEISEKTELHRGRAGDRAFKPALRTNQVPNNAESPFPTNQIPNKRFIVQSSRFVSSTDGALNPSATANEESSGASFGHPTEPGAARLPATEMAAPPVVVPAIVVYNFYPIPTGEPKKQVKNKKERGISHLSLAINGSVANSKRQRQSGRKAPRKRPRVNQADRGGTTPERPKADRGGIMPERPRKGGATPRHPNADRDDITPVRPRSGDRGGSLSERRTPGSSSSAGVFTFKYRAEIPLEVPLSRTWIESAFS